jgi:hypothetical protein
VALQERPGLVAVLVGPRSAKTGLNREVAMHPVKPDAGYELALTTNQLDLEPVYGLGQVVTLPRLSQASAAL